MAFRLDQRPRYGGRSNHLGVRVQGISRVWAAMPKADAVLMNADEPTPSARVQAATAKVSLNIETSGATLSAATRPNRV